MKPTEFSSAIKDKAMQVGFFRCGIAQNHKVNTSFFEQWLNQGKHAEMTYLSNHLSIRQDPTLLLEGAKSVIICAANYYPIQKQSTEAPQIAYYAYGKDYHKWLKKRLRQIEQFLLEHHPSIHTRSFVDTAPIFERYWAAQAGIGFIGKNNNLIIPDSGSYFLLGGVLVDVELAYDTPLDNRCGDCQACIKACPSQALEAPYSLNARRCLSYRTIEHKGDWSSLPNVPSNNRLYGCDACQQACPFNRFAVPSNIPECTPLPFVSEIETLISSEMSEEEFEQAFCSSPIKRIRREGFLRNSKLVSNHYNQ